MHRIFNCKTFGFGTVVKVWSVIGKLRTDCKTYRDSMVYVKMLNCSRPLKMYRKSVNLYRKPEYDIMFGLLRCIALWETSYGTVVVLIITFCVRLCYAGNPLVMRNYLLKRYGDSTRDGYSNPLIQRMGLAYF